MERKGKRHYGVLAGRAMVGDRIPNLGWRQHRKNECLQVMFLKMNLKIRSSGNSSE